MLGTLHYVLRDDAFEIAQLPGIEFKMFSGHLKKVSDVIYAIHKYREGDTGPGEAQRLILELLSKSEQLEYLIGEGKNILMELTKRINKGGRHD